MLNNTSADRSMMTRVLVVDDDPGLRQLVGIMLASIGCKMVEAEDGYEALTILRADPGFAVVISDVHMARMDGVRFLTELRAQQVTIPVILSSVDFSSDWINVVMQQGAAAYLPRPFTPRQLVAVVKQVLGKL
jgi:DNA-binding NtrC family response regulator